MNDFGINHQQSFIILPLGLGIGRASDHDSKIVSNGSSIEL